MENHDQLHSLVSDLAEAMLEYDRLAFDEEDEHQLGPPASPAQIAIFERALGAPLPPSYRSFLELHNGWSDFDGEAKLLAVEDHESPWVKERINDMSDLFFEDDGDNPFLNGMLPILLGENEDNYLVLDPSTRRENGEMDFIMYDYGEEEERFSDFTSFLRDVLDVTREMIKDELEGTTDDQ